MKCPPLHQHQKQPELFLKGKMEQSFYVVYVIFWPFHLNLRKSSLIRPGNAFPIFCHPISVSLSQLLPRELLHAGYFLFFQTISVNPRNGYTHLAPTTMPCSKQLCNHTENNNYDRFVGPLLSKLAAIVHYTNLCILLCYTCPNVQEACLLYVNHVRVFSDLLLWIEIIFELVLDGEFSSLGDQGLLIHINTSEQTKIHGLKTSRFKWVKYVTCNRKCGDMILLAQADCIK